MLGDPLYRDVSTPSASHIESAPEVASCPSTREAAKPVQEDVSTSSRQVDDEVKEVAVSCGDLESLITSEECTRISQMYGLQVVEPTDLEKPHVLPIRHVTLS